MKSFLAEFFDCGEADLRILENLDGTVLDLPALVETIHDEGFFSLNDIIYAAFDQAIVQLQEAFDERRDGILDDLEEIISDETGMLKEDGCSAEEIAIYASDPHNPLGEAAYDLDLLQSDQLHPASRTEHSFYCNMSDSNIGLAFLGFYRHRMPDTLEQLENAIGFSFVDY